MTKVAKVAKVPDGADVNLSDEQRAARDCDDQYVVVLASAGSGKTEVVAQRVERILTGGTGFRVIALSYTRRAAAELRDRFASRLDEEHRRVETDTLHGFAQGLLLQYGTWIDLPAEPIIVVDDADRVELLQEWRSSMGMPLLDDPKEQLARLDLARARGEDDPIAEDWDTALTEAGALDYEAMLARAKELLDVPAVARLVARVFRHVIVDEAQNLTASQYEFLKQLFLAGRDVSHVMLVGDDKQSIVGFAGASPQYLHEFERDFSATVFRLTQNFRSAADIVTLGDRIAAALGDPPSTSENYAARGSVGRMNYTDERAEAIGISEWVSHLLADGLPSAALAPGEDPTIRAEDIAVLGRTASSLRASQAALESAGHTVAVATHADDWLGSDVARSAWLLATFRPDSAVSRRRIQRELSVDAGSRDSARDSLSGSHAEELREFAAPLSPQEFVIQIETLDVHDDEFWARDQAEILSVWKNFCDRAPQTDRSWPQFELFVARWQRGDGQGVGVRLHTVHKAQGREYKAVAVIGLNDGQFPDFRARTAKDLEAELRAFYVAVTRPSRALLLTRPERIQTRNGPWARPASRFLEYVG
ncbi:ATP-dependent helicase [Nocardioides sp. InS609-2]|uniref:ATP-dependent helicase n=1 Tax=Nocardioides sp. InS609-2 TaxID=2760705 RepID=UPI0020C12198|nr:ATP-dependent helicase [Nocardioides sp. InS609-2]